jgi:hypothetical protein
VKGFSLKADWVGQNVIFELDGPVSKFQVNEYVSGSLTAAMIKNLAVKSGDLGADVVTQSGEIGGLSVYGDINANIESATFIKKVSSKAGGIGSEASIVALDGDLQMVSTYDSIAGKLGASNIIKKVAVKAGDVTGNIRAAVASSVSALNLDGALISAADLIGKVLLKGDILDSYILSGYDIGMDVEFGLQETGGGDVLGGGDIKSISAKGEFARSFISAGYLPSSVETSSLPSVDTSADFGSIGAVKFGSVDPDPTFEFGLFAVTDIKPFKIGKEPAQTEGLFQVEIVGD